MNESWEHYVKWNKPIPKRQIVWLYLYKKFMGVKITEAERMLVARGWGRKEWMGRYLMDLMGIVSISQDEKS